MAEKKVTNLQIAIEQDLKEKAEEMAKKYGFNTLQDLVRFLLAGINDQRIIPGVDPSNMFDVLLKGLQRESLKDAADGQEPEGTQKDENNKGMIIARRLKV